MKVADHNSNDGLVEKDGKLVYIPGRCKVVFPNAKPAQAEAEIEAPVSEQVEQDTPKKRGRPKKDA